MPTYEYRCPAGHSFEKFYPTMNDSRHVKCPTCGKRHDPKNRVLQLGYYRDGYWTVDEC